MKIFDDEIINSKPEILKYRNFSDSEYLVNFLKDCIDDFIDALDPGLNFLEIW
jgi:hypothetical protein